MTQATIIIPVDAKTADWPRKVATVLNRLQNTTALAGISATWGSIGGTLSDQTDLQTALNGKLSTSHAGSGGTAHANAVASGAAGFLTGADKAKLDAISGTNTGDQTITLTGDVTGSGTGSFATTLANTAVTPGSYTSADITVDAKGRITAAANGAGGAGVTDGDKGDITVSSSGTVWTVDNDAITYAKLQDASAGNVVLTRANSASGDYGETALAASRLLGRGSTGDIAAISLGNGLAMSGTTLSAQWSLVTSWTWSTNVTQVDFTNLGSYSELLVVCRGITGSVSSFRGLRVSVDNGSTFYSTSGDYVQYATTGVETNVIQFDGVSAAASAARSFNYHILATNVAGPKRCLSTLGNDRVFVASTSPINALRYLHSDGGNITAGSIYVYGR